MKRRLLFFFMLIITNVALAQAPLQLNFQGVARNAQGNALANQNIQVRLSIHDLTPTGAVVYSETRITTTNMVGVFNLIIGSKGATNVSGTILGVNWGIGNKFLQLEFDPAGNGAFIDLGTTQFQSVPYALNAYTATPIGEAGGDLNGYYPKPTIANNAINASKIANLSITDIKIANVSGAKVTGDIKGNAANVTGIVAIANGGTGATTVNAVKQNFGLNNVENTKDIDKPVSLATQAFLSSKLSVVDTAAMLAPYKKSTFSSSALNTKLNIIDTAFMLRNYAKTASLSSKAPLNSPTFTGTVSGITSSMIGLGNVNNTSDVNKPISISTQNALDTKASSSSLSLKVNVVDTASMLSPYAKLGSVNSVMASKLNKSDTTLMLSAYAKNSSLSLKAPLASPVFTGTVSGITSVMVGLGNVDNISDANKPISIATQTALALKASNSDLALKAPLASPTFTGTVSGITSVMVGLGNVDNTRDANKPISTATQTALNALNTDLALKAPLASPTFTGTVSGITSVMVGLGNVDNIRDANKPISTATQTALNALNTDLALKAPIASPTFTGIVSGITSVMVGLGNVDNTSDANKQISTATQTALDLKAPLASPTFTGTVAGITSTMVGLGNVDNTSDANKPVSTPTATALGLKVDKVTGERLINATEITKLGNQSGTNTGDQDLSSFATTSATNTALALKANIASPTFTGTVSGITSAMVGLGNVDNTSDANKPISTATQTALDLKAPLASPTFTGTVSGITSAMIGLGNVNNTSDANKPISTATQTALDLKAPLASPTFTGTVSGITSTMVGLGNVNNTSDANKPVSTSTQTALDLKAPLASPTFTGILTAATIIKSGGTSSQYLMADGTVSTGTAAVREVADEFSATASQTTFTLTQAPSANSKVKMFINGIRISNTAYSIVGTTLTYNAVNNGSYVLTASDRIQFDYYY